MEKLDIDLRSKWESSVVNIFSVGPCLLTVALFCSAPDFREPHFNWSFTDS